LWRSGGGAALLDELRQGWDIVDLGHIDLMVQEGLYSNRTDFIRTAIRNQLERHADVVKQSTVRKSLELGLRQYSREDLEAARRGGEMLHIHVLGLASIAPRFARFAVDSRAIASSISVSRHPHLRATT
jgi:Arc/MetJ-type ribon-helix-helix transcriptional regulator